MNNLIQGLSTQYVDSHNYYINDSINYVKNLINEIFYKKFNVTQGLESCITYYSPVIYNPNVLLNILDINTINSNTSITVTISKANSFDFESIRLVKDFISRFKANGFRSKINFNNFIIGESILEFKMLYGSKDYDIFVYTLIEYLREK